MAKVKLPKGVRVFRRLGDLVAESEPAGKRRAR